MTTLFISDLHLDPVRPGITELFLDFLSGRARSAETLYILGDLFEAWVGDDDPEPHHAAVAAGLATLAAAGTSIRFMAGNRDFLLGDAYAARAGMARLEEPLRLELGGVPTLILHGDTLCTDDTDYQAFRLTVRDPAWQRAFLARPLAERKTMAGDARTESRRRATVKAPEIMDVNQDAVERVFRDHGVRRMIHGHTHRPAVHRFELDGIARERIVLGDWYEQGSVLTVVGPDCKLQSFNGLST